MERITHLENPVRCFRTARRFSEREIRNYLEIGCGEGFGLQSALTFNWNVYGQDVSPDFAATVKCRTGIDIMVGRIHEFSYTREFFDFIYIDSVLEHVTNPVEFMKYITNFLAPGGVIYLVLPNENSIPNFLKDFVFELKGSNQTSRIMPFSEPYHIIGFSKQSILYLGKILNLTIPYLIRKFSYNHIERYKQSFSITQLLCRQVFGLVHRFCDTIDKGVNMEVVFVKSKAEIMEKWLKRRLLFIKNENT
ncbi:MAG: class I SAM-dependent methyltransferase [Candidatus Stahlbacteria bacterium]|nr:class I SAM-dependent methyltransferase [Candidatus Stahlbacteria bacterium]